MLNLVQTREDYSTQKSVGPSYMHSHDISSFQSWAKRGRWVSHRQIQVHPAGIMRCHFASKPLGSIGIRGNSHDIHSLVTLPPSKTHRGCLKPRIGLNPQHTASFPTHTHIFPLKGSAYSFPSAHPNGQHRHSRTNEIKQG